MEHSIIYKRENVYASFPLIHRSKTHENVLFIGFFHAPQPEHCGLYNWKVRRSLDEGQTWQASGPRLETGYNWPAKSAREKSDRFVTTNDSLESHPTIITGSSGFSWDGEEIIKSTGLFHRIIHDKDTEQRFYCLPDMEIVLTFPRALEMTPVDIDHLILIPAYGIMKNYEISRCLVWRSVDGGQSFRLWNMFPMGVEGNEMAFIATKNGILAHIRSDEHSYLMESWSEDWGITWTYPTNVFTPTKNFKNNAIIGGPPHLLRLKDGRIVCSYGYRFEPMGIRAIISEDEGSTWSVPIILRDDAGHTSSLSPEKWGLLDLFSKKPTRHPEEDVGYPTSIQLKDGSVLTVYYITTSDRITHIASTKWEV